MCPYDVTQAARSSAELPTRWCMDQTLAHVLPWAMWRSPVSSKTALRLPEKWEEIQLFVKSLKNAKN